MMQARKDVSLIGLIDCTKGKCKFATLRFWFGQEVTVDMSRHKVCQAKYH